MGIIKNRKFNDHANAERIALLAMYHDTSEVITGDLPTPIKYYNSDISDAYKKIEKMAQQKLLNMLPEELQENFCSLLDGSSSTEEEKILIKQADSLCAYIKCLEELSVGNNEFIQAKERLEEKLKEITSPEMDYFVKHFLPSFSLSLDQIS